MKQVDKLSCNPLSTKVFLQNMCGLLQLSSRKWHFYKNRMNSLEEYLRVPFLLSTRKHFLKKKRERENALDTLKAFIIKVSLGNTHMLTAKCMEPFPQNRQKIFLKTLYSHKTLVKEGMQSFLLGYQVVGVKDDDHLKNVIQGWIQVKLRDSGVHDIRFNIVLLYQNPYTYMCAPHNIYTYHHITPHTCGDMYNNP